METNRIVIFDIDGTILLGQSQLLLIKYLHKKKVISKVYFLRLYLWFFLYKVGFVNDPVKVFKYAIVFLKNKKITWADKILQDFVRECLSHHFLDDMLELLEYHKSNGDRIILLSNAMDILVENIGKHLHISENIGTKLEVDKGIFTGNLKSGITYGAAKLVRIKEYIKNSELIRGAVFYTDHHSDIPLLQEVKYPIVVNPTKYLLYEAKKRGWKIIINK
jgi:HAD superfamily hydrolase (TIGR01490 family)